MEPLEYTYTDIYNYPRGVLVYVEAEGDASAGSATSFKNGAVTYNMRITNQGSASQTVDLKYALPGMFDKNTAVSVSGATFNISSTGNELLWNAYVAPPGESTIRFKVKAP